MYVRVIAGAHVVCKVTPDQLQTSYPETCSLFYALCRAGCASGRHQLGLGSRLSFAEAPDVAQREEVDDEDKVYGAYGDKCSRRLKRKSIDKAAVIEHYERVEEKVDERRCDDDTGAEVARSEEQLLDRSVTSPVPCKEGNRDASNRTNHDDKHCGDMQW